MDYNPEMGDIEVITTTKSLYKTAEISSEMQSAIQEIVPNKEKSYILCNALGSGEYWGANKNADYFPEDSLQKYAKTFESAGIFKHHQNKDMSKSLGKVVYAHYNPDMHRVELLLEVDKKRAPDIVQRIEQNEKIAVSMGCKVPYDVCSICYKKASKSHEYCDHIKKEKNKVYPDGRKVAMVNTRPTFFDISFVTIPADRGGYMMKKVAEMELESELSAKLGEEWLNEHHLKESDINKRLNITDEDVIPLEVKHQRLQVPKHLPGDLPKDWLDESLAKTSSSELLTALGFSQIMPTPKDFQYIVLHNDDEKLANELYEQNIVFDVNENNRYKIPSDWNINNLNSSALSQCVKVAHTHSLTVPNILARELYKTATALSESEAKSIEDPMTAYKSPLEKGSPSIKNPLFTLGVLSGLYYAFNRFFKSVGIGNPSALEHATYRNPILLPLLVGGASFGAVKLQEMDRNRPTRPGPVINDTTREYEFSKTASTNYWLERALLTIPGTYVYSGYQETRRQRGEELNSVQDFIRKHPLLSSIGAYAASKPIAKGIQKTVEKYGELANNLFFTLSFDKLKQIYDEIA